MKFAHWIVLGLACSLPLAANAQWQWLDQNGKKVYSDKAPPPDVPEKSILRSPAASSSRPTFTPLNPGTPGDTAAKAETAEAKPPAPKPPSGVDKELEEKAKKAEEAEKARKADEARKLAEAKAENCKRARQGQATFDSGMRVARVNAQGEREIMDDKMRADEQRRLKSVIDSDCK